MLFHQSCNMLFWFSVGSQQRFQNSRLVHGWNTRSCASFPCLLQCDYIWCLPLLPRFFFWDCWCSIVLLWNRFHPQWFSRHICWCVMSVHPWIFAFPDCWLCGGVFQWMFSTLSRIWSMDGCRLGLLPWYFCFLWIRSSIEMWVTFGPLWFILSFLSLYPQRCICVWIFFYQPSKKFC